MVQGPERAVAELKDLLLPFFTVIKAIHVVAASLWGFSTAVAFTFYLKPAFRRVHRKPEDERARETLNRMMEAFDRGATLEHVALAILIATAGLMLWLGGVDLTRWSFITAKLWVGILIILPMEAIDIYLSHMGGSKQRIRKSGDLDRYDRMMAHHWTFLRITEPLVIVLVPTMFFIAIVKPF